MRNDPWSTSWSQALAAYEGPQQTFATEPPTFNPVGCFTIKRRRASSGKL